MRHIQNKNVRLDLSFLEIRDTVLKGLHLPHKGSRCFPRLSLHKHWHVQSWDLSAFEKRNGFVIYWHPRVRLRWGVPVDRLVNLALHALDGSAVVAE